MSENVNTDITHVISNRFLKNHKKNRLEMLELKKRKNRLEKKLIEVEGSFHRKLSLFK